MTQDHRFQLLAFASSQTRTPVLVQRDEEIEAITRALYIPAERRRDGDGTLVETTVFAGYRVAFGDEEMLAIVASVGILYAGGGGVVGGYGSMVCVYGG